MRFRLPTNAVSKGHCASRLNAKGISFMGKTVLLMTAMAGSASAATTIFSDTFTDGGFTNGTDANDIPWFTSAGTNVTLGVGADSGTGGINTGNALNVTTTSTFRGTIGTFSDVTILAGQTLRLTFNVRFTSSISANDFRVGLYNSASTTITTQGDTASQSNDYGYGFSTNTGASSSTATSVYTETAGDTIGSGGAGPGTPGAATKFGTTGASTNLGTTATSMTFDITRSGAALNLLATLGSGATASGTVAAPLNSTYNFNEVLFFNTGNSQSFRLDNVSLTLIPEPSALLLGAFGMITLLRRRR